MKLAISNRRLLVLFLFLLVISVTIFALARSGGDERVDSWETDYADTVEERVYRLDDVRDASSMNITVYRGEERPLYLGWSGGSEEMENFVNAVADAAPADGTTDESFSDLVVFFFADGDSFSVTYSRERGLLMFEDQLYKPADDITAIIRAGEERYD